MKMVAIADFVIQGKTANLLESIDYTLPGEKQISMKFSSGWLWRF